VVADQADLVFDVEGGHAVVRERRQVSVRHHLAGVSKGPVLEAVRQRDSFYAVAQIRLGMQPSIVTIRGLDAPIRSQSAEALRPGRNQSASRNCRGALQEAPSVDVLVDQRQCPLL
jgi:hypothetical protein